MSLKSFLKTFPMPKGGLSKAVVAGVALAAGVTVSLPVIAQTPLLQARQAVEARKAVFVLIGANFRPLGDEVKGNKPFDGAETKKRAERLVFLSDLLNEAFPPESNIGQPDTKAKDEIWTKHDDFAKKLSDFQAHAKAFAQVASTETSVSDAFKASFTTLAGDCKGCHEDFKQK